MHLRYPVLLGYFFARQLLPLSKAECTLPVSNNIERRHSISSLPNLSVHPNPRTTKKERKNATDSISWFYNDNPRDCHK